jgi:hypothetical protein
MNNFRIARIVLLDYKRDLIGDAKEALLYARLREATFFNPRKF